jgi:hypothetical protein
MKTILSLYAALHALTAFAFAAAAVVLIAVAGHAGLVAVMQGIDIATAEAVIEAVGLLAAAVVALQISQTVLEEEVVRDAHIGAPTRVRRFLSRFMVVIVVAVRSRAWSRSSRPARRPRSCSTAPPCWARWAC